MRLRRFFGLGLLILLLGAPGLADRTDDDVLVVGEPLVPNFEALVVLGYIGSGSILIDDTPVSPFVEVIDAIALGAGTGGTGVLTATGPGTTLVLDGDPTFHNAGFIVGAATAGGGIGIADILDGATLDVDGTASDPNDPMGAYLVLSPFPNAMSTMVVDASTVTVRNGSGPTSTLSVGIQGEGSLTISGGSSVSMDTGSGAGGGTAVGVDANGDGELIVTGAGSELTALGDSNQFVVGLSGIGVLDVLDGGSLVGQRLNIGLNATSQGFSEIAAGSTVDLSGQDIPLGLAAGVSVGAGGTGELLVSDSTVVVDSNAGGAGPGVLIGGSTVPPQGGSGVVRVSGPTAQVDLLGPLMGLGVGIDGDGTLEISGGAGVEIENPDSFSGTSVGLLAGSDGTVRVTGAGSRLDAGELLRMGLDFGLLDSGTALVEVGEGATLSAVDTFLGADATLAGDGAVVGNVTNLRGTLVPGGSPGVLNVTGFVLQSGGTTRAQTVGTAPGDTGQIDATGTVAFNGGALAFDLLAGFLPETGQELTFASAGAGASIDPNTTTSVAGVGPGFQFEVVSANGGNDLIVRALNDAASFGACQVSQLKAASTLCKKHFLCASKYAKKPSKDETQAKRGSCEQKAAEKFTKSYDKAAAKSSATCGTADPAATFAGQVTAGADAITDAILAGWDPAAGDKEDDKLRGALVKEAGTLCGKVAAAASKNLKKPNDAKRVAAIDKAAATFDTKSAKALTKATGKGVTYTGAPADQVRDETDQLAAELAGATGGVLP